MGDMFREKRVEAARWLIELIVIVQSISTPPPNKASLCSLINIFPTPPLYSILLLPLVFENGTLGYLLFFAECFSFGLLSLAVSLLLLYPWIAATTEQGSTFYPVLKFSRLPSKTHLKGNFVHTSIWMNTKVANGCKLFGGLTVFLFQVLICWSLMPQNCKSAVHRRAFSLCTFYMSVQPS